tara:strand:+ start:1641 stop:2168 length:528 start_codon:yes stop_codon:yes gene_type:complete
VSDAHVQAAATIGSLQGACDAHIAHIAALKKQLAGSLESLVQARARRDEFAITIAELTAQLEQTDSDIVEFRQCTEPHALRALMMSGLAVSQKEERKERNQKLSPETEAINSRVAMAIDTALGNGGELDTNITYRGRYRGDLSSLLQLRDRTHDAERRYNARKNGRSEDTIVEGR